MTKEREALKLALEALCKMIPCDDVCDCTGQRAITAIQEALAQPAQEPSQWRDMVVVSLVREGINKHKARELAHHFATILQQPAQEPVGPIADGWSINFSNGHSGLGVYAHLDEYPEEGAILLSGVPKWATDAIREVRAQPAQEIDAVETLTEEGWIWDGDQWQRPPQPEQEPVAWTVTGQVNDWSKDFSAYQTQHYTRPVYTTPPKRPWVGLTDNDYLNALDNHPYEGSDRELWLVLEAKLKELNT